MMATRVTSPEKNLTSPNISVTRASPTHNGLNLPTMGSTINALYSSSPSKKIDDDRYYTASSGDDDDDIDLDDDDDDEMCLVLNSDDDDMPDNGSLSGLHINLKTLQAVSNMLAHYIPIIQRDINGNPLFVPPPPPVNEYTSSIPSSSAVVRLKSPKLAKLSETSSHASFGDDGALDFQLALQDLDNVITAEEDNTFLVDVSEITDVMGKMTYYAGDEIDDI